MDTAKTLQMATDSLLLRLKYDVTQKIIALAREGKLTEKFDPNGLMNLFQESLNEARKEWEAKEAESKLP